MLALAAFVAGTLYAYALHVGHRRRVAREVSAWLAENETAASWVRVGDSTWCYRGNVPAPRQRRDKRGRFARRGRK